MLPDPETEQSIKDQLVNTLAASFDDASYDEDGRLFIVQDGYWFRLSIEVVDNGEEA